MSSKQLDTLISEIRGLRSDINMLMENQVSNQSLIQPQTQQNVISGQQQPVIQKHVDESALNTLFGMPMPESTPVAKTNTTNDVKSILDRAKLILA